ncbi:MAG: polyprenyl synthetase family protein [Flavobacteriales bacterium]|jgi:geranylgeranyl diphosphate synthase type II|nr:polyprenyl synthetase family protein [Flavobacteriales bacterium]MBT3964334.1 polyprenyl synthetase family protein [Flavobacteriales bacterium]MBT4706166.1 polyprenyl synthetase family protein [Flavobacteriales bacterium]MBT4931351.1 polyprenyl synthetase family protein [Flavobacteriales bacterium]MBT5133215.1 polyprenyl synthetase family protein [Flavobacteriales bacterium]
MNSHLNQLREAVENGLAQLSFPAEPTKLYEPIRYTLSLGGKRIRPILTLLGAQLMGLDPKKAMHQALAIEIFHNFTLVHDDIMDDAEVRRSLPTVHKKWDEDVALLSGDGMMILAYQELFQAESSKLPQLQSIFSKAAMEVCEGQQLDMDFATRSDVSIDEYLEMIRLKTAVLLGAAASIGAVVGGANDDQIISIKKFAESMGIVFQIRDDYLDAFGAQSEFGKQIGGDIKEGKRTWLYLKALELCSTDSERTEIIDAMNYSDPEKRIEQVLNSYERLGIKDKAEEEINRMSQESTLLLENVEGDEKTKELLKELVQFLMGRTT